MRSILSLLAVVLSCVSVAATPDTGPAKVLFEENFAGPLSPGWAWVRENPKAWRLDNGALILDTLPGSLWLNANDEQNILLRQAPVSGRGGFVVEVQLTNQPQGAFEHAGLICYYDDDNWVALTKEHTGGSALVLLSEQNGRPLLPCPEKPYTDRAVSLRMAVARGKVQAQYRAPDETGWHTLGECPLPHSSKLLWVGVLSGQGLNPPQRQARFRSFRILEDSRQQR